MHSSKSHTILRRMNPRRFSSMRALLNEQTQSTECKKFLPRVPSAQVLRHLRFTVPLDYSKGQAIQEKFSKASIEFKRMASKIDRKKKELLANNQTTNDYETQLLESILQMKPSPTILTFQFKPVFTAGKREKGRLAPEEIDNLKSFNYEFVQTNRGGEISFHNPGQLVAYPIFDLQDFNGLTIKCFVSKLEDSIIDTLRKFDVQGKKTSNTGVWIDEMTKISSIGLSVSRSVTSHGVSVNVCNEIPKIETTGHVFCGLPGKAQTTILEQSGKQVEVNDVATELVRSIARTLNIGQIELVDLEDLDID